MWLNYRVMSPDDTDLMINSVDPDQTAPSGAVWSGSTLFAQACVYTVCQACLSEYLGPLQCLDWDQTGQDKQWRPWSDI